MMRCLLLAVGVGLAAAPVLGGPELLPVRGVHYATYDLASGELRPAEAPVRIGTSVWAATAGTGWYFPSYSYGWNVLDWGDLADDGYGTTGTDIGGFAFAYATSLMMPTTLDAIIVFYGDDDGFDTGTRFPLAGYWIANLPTGTTQGNVWTVTVDLQSQGLEFTMEGNDLDGDELLDFSYMYWFINLPPSATGPWVAYDPNVTPARAPGCADAFDAFDDPNLIPGSYRGTYWFGGDPYAQFYMELFDMFNNPGPQGCPNPGDSGKFCLADIHPNDGDGTWFWLFDGDCIVGLDDLAQLLCHYGTTGGATHEDGDVWPENGDGIWEDWADGDGRVDLADLSELLGQYGDDCRKESGDPGCGPATALPEDAEPL